MEITELAQLTRWIQQELQKSGLIAKFDNLIGILNQNSRKSGNQPSQPFSEQQKTLTDALYAVKLNLLSLSQLQALETLGLRENLGKYGATKLEGLLKDTFDIGHVTQEVEKMKAAIAAGIQQADQIREAVSRFADDEALMLPAEEVLTRVVFSEDASIDNIANLRKWSLRWYQISRGFTAVTGKVPQDVRVVGATRGSFVLELAAGAVFVLPLAKAVNLTLDSMVKYRDFQLKSLELRNRKASDERWAEDFEAEAKRWDKRANDIKKEAAEDVTGKVKEMIPDYKADHDGEFGIAVKHLVDFLSKGGVVDCVIPDKEEDDDEETQEALDELQEQFDRIRETRESLQLEYRSDSPSDTDSDGE